MIETGIKVAETTKTAKQHRTRFLILWTALCVGAIAQLLNASELSRGHRIIAEKGLNIMALCSPQIWGGTIPPTPPCQTPDLARLAESNFTGIDFLGNDRTELYVGTAPGIPWSRWTAWSESLRAAELPYLPSMVSFQYGDEQDITDSVNLQNAAAWMTASQQNYPNVLCHLNQYGGQNTYEELQNFVAIVKPDIVTFDTYQFRELPWLGQCAPAYYSSLSQYRAIGLAGHDGIGTSPIPYGLYLQTFIRFGHTISESEMRLNQFSAWAFGYTFAKAFVYTDASGDTKSVLFSGIDDVSPTPLFYQMAETNRQSRNLGSSLVRLISTNLTCVVGMHNSLSWPYAPEKNNWPTVYDTPEWSAAADPYITAVTVTNIGTVNDGLVDSVIIGYFEPLFEEDDGPDFENELYFMVVNTLCGKTATAAEATQLIRLNFDFADSGITRLLRRSRDTGLVEVVPLVHEGGTLYHLDLSLEGGTGDLFKFDTGALFVGSTWTCADRITQGYGFATDLNHDCTVNTLDLAVLASDWFRCLDAHNPNCEKPWEQ